MKDPGKGTWLRTLRHVRLSQLIWRVRYTLERQRNVRTSRWKWTDDHSPPIRNDVPELPLPYPADPTAVEQLRKGRVRILGHDRSVGYDRPDWRLGPVSTDRLGTITLHYQEWVHDAARAGAADVFAHYVDDWITRCPLHAPGARHLAWNAYTVATRIGWWVRAAVSNPVVRTPALLQSLWEQAGYLRDHLEWDLRANHLLRDMVGLAWAGRFFAGERPAEWLRAATKYGVEQVREQVLPDGGHFERSPMYHAHTMDDVLSLAMLVEDLAVSRELREIWRRMAEFAAWVRHPDGQIPLLNDAALNGGSAPPDLFASGRAIGVAVDESPRLGFRHFPDTGLAVWHCHPWDVFFDVGRIGPDEQPGHAHADSLTIECSYQGRRLFVDPGTFAYDDDDRRRYDRSTAAHNTVCLDRTDSSEVWHIFRVGRRAYPIGLVIGEARATAAHTGYDHLPGRPRHTRTVTPSIAGPLTVRDVVEGSGSHAIDGGWLLAPEWVAYATAGGWEVRNSDTALRVAVRGPAGLSLAITKQPYHPEFGRTLDATRLVWHVNGPLPVEITTTVTSQ